MKPAVPQLLALLQHQDARVRETAGGALRNITDSLVHLHRRHTNPTPARSAPWGKREDATTAHAARNAKIGEALECLHPLMEYIAITLDTPGAPASSSSLRLWRSLGNVKIEHLTQRVNHWSSSYSAFQHEMR